MKAYAFNGRLPLYLWVGQVALYVTGYVVGSAVGWAYERVTR